MDYLVGNENEFFEFLNLIKPEEKIAILTHTDLDGIASGIFLEEILSSIKLKVSLIEFVNYEQGICEKIIPKLQKEKIKKVFISDVCIESVDEKGFEKLRKDFEVFLIDHHPLSANLKNKKNILKTKTFDCSAFVIYCLGVEKSLIGGKKFQWLVNSTMISELSYKDPKNLKFLQQTEKEINLENIFDSEFGRIANIIGGALIYFNSKKIPLIEIYSLVKKKDLNSLKKFDEEVKKEIEKKIKEFEKEQEFYPEKSLHLFYFDSEFKITSTLSTIISSKNPDEVFVLIRDSESEPEKIKVSARCQSGKFDMNLLIKKSIENLENAVGGGYVPASGATIMKKDFQKFKTNILEFLKP